MKLIDRYGRLFGKLSLLDLGAGVVLLCVLAGLFLLPGRSGTSLAQMTAAQPIEVDILVLGLSTPSPQDLIPEGSTANFIIRNQPYGQVTVKNVQVLPRTVTVSQPDGSVKALPDPRPEMAFSSNLLLTLEGRGQITKNGPVLGNTSIKVGTPVELEGKEYNFRASVIAVRPL